MKWVIKVIQQVRQLSSVTLERQSFIEGMENMLSEVTMELSELVMAGEKKTKGSKLGLYLGLF